MYNKDIHMNSHTIVNSHKIVMKKLSMKDFNCCLLILDNLPIFITYFDNLPRVQNDMILPKLINNFFLFSSNFQLVIL